MMCISPGDKENRRLIDFLETKIPPETKIQKIWRRNFRKILETNFPETKFPDTNFYYLFIFN